MLVGLMKLGVIGSRVVAGVVSDIHSCAELPIPYIIYYLNKPYLTTRRVETIVTRVLLRKGQEIDLGDSLESPALSEPKVCAEVDQLDMQKPSTK
jgi:hypothetical protein